MKDYIIGDLGFDPLKLKPSDSSYFREFVEIEINHGRLAMIAFIGMLGQEYLTGKPIVQSLIEL